ncbi:hypothetical protein LUZ60_017469 [Juncus effusus]|nr:hypothetical protein LUZ60_017469 [Juncus effusus]
MSRRAPGYYLSNGLYVSGRPDQSKEKISAVSSAPAPYTGGDLKNSGEFEKMFKNSGPQSGPQIGTGSKRSGPQTGTGTVTRQQSGPQIGTGSGTRQKSGPQNVTRQKSGPQTGTGTGTKSNSGPIVKKSSGPQSGGSTPILPTTGLITSGPLKSASSSGPLLTLTGQSQSQTLTNNGSITSLAGQSQRSIKRGPSRVSVWVLAVFFVLAFGGGSFVIYAWKNWICLFVVGGLFAMVLGFWVWNLMWGEKAVVLGFMGRYADAELRSAKDGQFVKVTGIVTCGGAPLESSFLRVPRCVYTSTALYEYRGWRSATSANHQHRRLSWGLRSLERHVGDFYISDFQTGLRALVKAGNGARVLPFVDEPTAADINASETKSLPPDFLAWLARRNLSSDDRLMRLKEGFIKEGSTVSVMGVVQRNDNILMIVPPSAPVSTGCDWCRLLLPASLDAIVLSCQDASESDVIPV